MSRVVSHFSTLMILASSLGVMLALGTGHALPHGEQLLFSSAHNWQDWDVSVNVLDMSHGLAQPVFIGRSDNVPGFPIVWSPDGQHVAYVLNFPYLETDVLDFRTMGVQPLLGQAADLSFDAEWAPDGRSLAFIGIHDGVRSLYLAGADGSHPRQLTDDPGYKNLAWSPDSSRIALEMGVGDEDIGVVAVRDGHVTRLTQDGARDIRPAWSLDGNQIAFLSSRAGVRIGGTRFDLYLTDSVCDHCLTRRLTDSFPADSSWQITWSPDGERLLLGSTAWTGGDDIYLVNTLTGTVQNVTGDADLDSSPVWSPDGQQFAYESHHNGSWTIFLADADGQQRTRLMGGSYDKRRPMWSPDGTQIVFIANPGRNWDIYLMNVEDGSNSMRRLTDGLSIDFSPIWRPS
jgi:TolB protein